MECGKQEIQLRIESNGIPRMTVKGDPRNRAVLWRGQQTVQIGAVKCPMLRAQLLSFVFFFFNLRWECLNEPEADCYLNLVCLVLMTFLFSVTQPWLVEGVWAWHTAMDVVCLDLFLKAGGWPWKPKMQSSPFPLHISGRCPVPVHTITSPAMGCPVFPKTHLGIPLW